MSGPLYQHLVARFAQLEAELNGLDAAAGDGDHGSTMLRGLTAAAAGGARSFRESSGGAAGSLFGALLTSIEKHLDTDQPLHQALAEAAGRISRLGQAQPGDKTMLDALVPAAEAAAAAPLSARQAAADAASTAAAGTASLSAKRGRARYVEGAGLGHVDAGARSVAEILAELAALTETQP